MALFTSSGASGSQFQDKSKRNFGNSERQELHSQFRSSCMGIRGGSDCSKIALMHASSEPRSNPTKYFHVISGGRGTCTQFSA
jgi:hypothetical protein